MKTIDTLDNNVFRHLITTIGALPTSFIDSMSYYEMIAWLVDYLQKEVVPAVNNNAEAVKEIQEWIETLDIQDEVDTKLEEMAQSGELAEVIAQFLNAQCVFAFDTISDMAAGEAFAAGSIARVLGNTNPLTGDGAYYRIRTLINTDVIDGVNLVALTNFDTLVAERIPDYQINQLTPVVNANAAFVSRANNRKVIIIGDSYANRTNSWADQLKTLAGLSDDNCNIRKYSGVGFVNTVDGKNFGTLLVDSITIPANEVTDIIVCGGWNDGGKTEETLSAAINSFLSTAHSTYPNATVYIGYISWFDCNYPDISQSVPFANVENCLALYKKYSNNGFKCKYLNNVEYALHDQALIDSSHFHPTEAGQAAIARAVMNAWMNGSTDTDTRLINITSTFTPAENIGLGLNERFYSSIDNGTSTLMSTDVLSFTFDGTTSYNLGNTTITLGKIEGGYVIGRGVTTEISVTTLVKTHSDGYYKVPTALRIQNGELVWLPRMINRAGNNWVTGAVDYVDFDSFRFDVGSISQY